MPEDNSTTVSEEGVTKKNLLKRMFGFYEIILIVLILLSIIGIGITDFSRQTVTFIGLRWCLSLPAPA